MLFKGKPGEALEILRPDAPQDIPSEVVARKRILLADAFCRLGQTQKAATILSETEASMPTNDPVLPAELALTRGRCASGSDKATAEKYFSSASSLAHGNDEFIEATGLLNVGFLLLSDDRYVEAINKFLEGLNVTSSPLLQDRMLGNLGFAYSQLGDWKMAISFSQRAEKMAAEINNPEAQERWLIDLGKAHFALWMSSEAEEARTDYLKALAIAQQLHDSDNVALCFHNLALIALRRNDPDSAEAYLREGIALSSKRENLHFALDAAKIAAARKQFRDAERMFRELLTPTGSDAALHSEVQRDLGRVYWDEAKSGQAEQMFRAEIATAEMALTRMSRPEYRMAFLDQDLFYDSYIQFLVAQGRPVEALRMSERSRAQVLAAALENNTARNPSISVPALQVLSKQRKQTIFAYSMTNSQTFLWVITPSSFKLFELPGQRDLFPLIRDFNQEIQAHYDIDNSPNGVRLYEALVQPAENLVPKGARVVIIPSRLLSLVNFEALIVPGDKTRYWIDDVDVQIASSLSLFSEEATGTRKNARHVNGLLAIGAPVDVSKDFPALKFAPEELRRVQNHFQVDQSLVFAGKEATPLAYRNSNPGSFRFIHLDTHGVSNDLNPLDSAIILSPAEDKSYKLYARDIKDIPLHAELVTISACYGAGTRWYNGEGIVGLAWGFMRAGAHQVVAALWEVDDASSPQLMDDFYSELVQGRSAAEALRDAKLKMLHSPDFHRHPYYWASLQLYTGS